MSGTEIRENLRRELGNDCVFECSNSRRPFLGGLHCRHFVDMVAGAATGDPPTIHDDIKGSSQYEVDVVVFGSLGDQRLTGGNREHFGAIGQVFGQLTITGDKPLIRESLLKRHPTPFSCTCDSIPRSSSYPSISAEPDNYLIELKHAVIIDGRAGAPGEGSAAKEDSRPHRLDLFEAVLSGFIAAFAVS